MDKATIAIYSQLDSVLKSKFVIHKRIGNGSFGSVFLVTDRQTSKKMALKLELIKQQTEPFLKKQWVVLQKLEGIPGIPKIYSFGKTERLAFVSMELLNKDLSQILKKQNELGFHFICDVAYSVLKILEGLHDKGIIHRDLKPQNIMLDKQNRVHLVDFGISKIHNSNKQPSSQNKIRFVGTPRYASITAHQRREQTPKDDIQSLLYVLIYLFKKQLPWMNPSSKFSQKSDEIGKIKSKTSRKLLCLGLPSCFLQAFTYIDRLNINTSINYDYLTKLFKQENTCFPQINLYLQPQLSKPKVIQFRRSFSQKQKKQSFQQSQQRLQFRRVSLQQSNLLCVPTASNTIEHSFSSNYDSQAHTSQKTHCEVLSNISEQPELQKNITKLTTKLVCYTIDQHSTSEESVDVKLKSYALLALNKGVLSKYYFDKHS